VRKHSKGCICLACCAARLASPKAPDPLQGSIFEPVRNDLPRSSFRESGTEPWPSGSVVGQERKEEALTAHDQRRRATLLWLRRQLASLYELRKAGAQGETYRLKPYVTADDAEMLLRANPNMDPGGAGAWKGSIFRGDDWQFTGDLIPSVIAENNGRGQRAWRYVGR
jgi:hypothetical protein